MPIKWQNGGDRTAVDFRPGGPGNGWIILDPNASVQAPQGGGRGVNRLWGRGDRYGLQPRGFNYSSNPNPYTFTTSYPLLAENFLKRFDCPFDIRIRDRCDRPDDLTSFSSPGMMVFPEGVNTNFSLSDPPAAMDGQEADVKEQLAVDAVIELRYTKVAHDDVSGSTSDVALKKIINVGKIGCNGDCGDAQTEEDAYWAVSAQDNTPGYSGNATARFYYRTSKTGSWSSVPIDPFTLADATDVIQMGQYVVVFSASKAPAYALFADILNGVTAPNLWQSATGLSSLSSTNFPKAAWAANSKVAYAVGNGGRIFTTSDGGKSWSILYDTGVVTSQNLNAIDGQTADLIYFGGNSGVFGRIILGAAALVTVKDASNNTLASNINVVRTPSQRGREVYLGTAGGEIWRSKNAQDTKPVFTNMGFDRAGSGSITDLNFAGYRGDVLFVLQTNASNYSRVLRDFSGGNLQADVEIIGDFNTPGNFKMNSIAPANPNYAMVVGELHNSFAFIGNIHQVF